MLYELKLSPFLVDIYHDGATRALYPPFCSSLIVEYVVCSRDMYRMGIYNTKAYSKKPLI